MGELFAWFPFFLRDFLWKSVYFSYNVYKHDCFFPQASPVWASPIFTDYLLSQELHHTTKQSPWGSRNMSHKLTCRPFGFRFPSFLLMYTVYETLFRKNQLGWPKNIIWMSVPSMRGQVPCQGCRFTMSLKILLNLSIQEPKCCISNKAKLWDNNETGHIAAKYLQTYEYNH